VAPSVNILGSFFPAWLICIVMGLVLTVIVRQVLVATNTAHHLKPAEIGYTSLAFVLIFATWLLVNSVAEVPHAATRPSGRRAPRNRAGA
jgi:urea transporter